jgi:hypothetical protein
MIHIITAGIDLVVFAESCILLLCWIIYFPFPESYTGGSAASGRATQAGQVEG